MRGGLKRFVNGFRRFRSGFRGRWNGVRRFWYILSLFRVSFGLKFYKS